ncbi:MAG: hypothetical protein M3O33_12155 [Cyanobacteriota bacterium]|nr:hypothetical protein [Cyanobacteriota bacterium]
MCLSNTHEPHLELAIDVFKSQNPALVISLKDFLTVLPNPKCVEFVIRLKVYVALRLSIELAEYQEQLHK